jgi:dephospho-CoA kinase
MLTVALTGGIAVGKSVVASRLEDLGCYRHDADKAAHALMMPDGHAWREIVAHFGPGILAPDRTIDRRRLGEIVFGDERERRFLNALIHPLVLEDVRRDMETQELKGRARVFVSEAALTIEAGFDRFFDKVVVVWCRPEVQLRRLMDRDGVDAEQAGRRVRTQMDLEEKKKRAHYLVDTSGTLDETLDQTDRLYGRLLKDEEEKSGRKG